jgi:cobalamin biosynthesis protein CobT
MMNNQLVGPFTNLARILSRTWNVNVVPSGFGARTDGHRIFIPFNADFVKPETGQVLHGLLDHELLHVLHERTHEESGKRTPLQILGTVPKRLARWLNVVMDTSIEAHCTLPGMIENLAYKNELLLARPGATSGERGIQRVFIGLSRRVRGYSPPKGLEWVGDFLKDEIEQARVLEWGEDLLALACAIMDKLASKPETEGEEPEAKSEGGEGEEGEGEEGEGEEGEGEEGDDAKAGAPPFPGTEEDSEKEDDEAEPESEPGDDEEEESGVSSSKDDESEDETEDGDDETSDSGEETDDSEDETDGAEGDTEDSDDETGSGDETEDEDGDDETEENDDEASGSEDDGEDEESAPASGSELPDEDDSPDDEEDGSDVESPADYGSDEDDDEKAPDYSKYEGEDPGDDLDDLRAHLESLVKEDTAGMYVPDPRAVELDRWIVWTAEDLKAEEELKEGTGRSWGDYQKLFEAGESAIGTLKARQLMYLQAKGRSQLRVDAEEGDLDAQVLPMVRMGHRNVFMGTTKTPELNTDVEILLDLSGSMDWGAKDRALSVAAVALAESLESGRVPSEFVGFHNRHVESLLDLRSRTPDTVQRQPFEFIVFKGWGESLRDCRKRFEHMYARHDNVDGEAVLTVARRLSARRARRKVLLVASDGNPQCYGTSPFQLFEHLKQSVRRVTSVGIEVIALGIQTDVVKQFYNKETGAKHIVINRISDLPGQLFGALGFMPR